MSRTAYLALEDGTVMRGRSCGAPGESSGELVFNTSMTGYQEVLTDPSYKGQIVMMTYPMIGNYGITAADNESRRPYLEGFVVRELCRMPSNWESVSSLGDFLVRTGVPCVEGVDTRALTRRIRDKGALRCVLSDVERDPGVLVKRARKLPSMKGSDLASAVTTNRVYEWRELLPQIPGSAPAAAPHVVVMDFGVKFGILRCLASAGARVSVVPARTTARDILGLSPDGILLSNGPGDPEPVSYAAGTVLRLIETGIPIFGICLGHQILAIAMGGKTFKMKFGHHGANHPVKDLATGRIEVTTQNHGFCVDLASLPGSVETTHVNLNDGTSEGLRHAKLPVFSVQFHPEASAGPHDSRHLFERFSRMMRARMAARAPGAEARRA